MRDDRQERIEARAHALWMEGGQQDGHSERDWARAEREIDAETHGASADGADMSAPATKPAKGKAKAEKADKAPGSKKGAAKDAAETASSLAGAGKKAGKAEKSDKKGKPGKPAAGKSMPAPA